MWYCVSLKSKNDSIIQPELSRAPKTGGTSALSQAEKLITVLRGALACNRPSILKPSKSQHETNEKWITLEFG